MNNQEYIKRRIEYYRDTDNTKGVKLSMKQAKECAEEDWQMYCEKYGYNKDK